MKKNRLLFLLLSLFMICVGARAEEVEIGSLDGAGNNSYLPMNSLYDYSYTQQIYTADEIGTAGTINSITVWLYGNANLYEMPFDIYMVQTDKDAFDSTTDWIPVTAKDIVYSGSVKVNHTDAQAYTFELSTPFDYDGSSNLVICFNNKTGQWKSGLNGKVFGADTDPKRALYVRQDGTAYDPTDMSGITANGHTYFRNVITLDIEGGAVACAKPTSFTADELLPRSVTLNWEGESDAYHLEYKKQAEEEWHSLLTGNSSSYTVTGLEPETAYQARVQAVCDAENSSKFRTISFTTPVACAAPTGFANPINTAATQLQFGWTPGDEDQDEWQVAYWADGDVTINDDNSFDETDPAVTILTANTSNIIISDLAPETKYWFAVRAFCGGEEYSKWLGPAYLSTEKLYPEPTGVTVSNIAAKSADISWTKGRDEKQWNLRYRPVKEIEIGDDDIEWTFEGSLGDWTTNDADGDGYDWDVETFATYGLIASASYVNNVGALEPDNWLISPEIELGGALVVSAFGVDGNYPAEVFAIYVTTDDGQSWEKVAGDFTATADAANYTADLSAYSGTGKVAIRHYNVTDQYMLAIEKITYIPGGIAEEPWIEENATATTFSITGLTPETEYEAQVQGVFGSGEDQVSEWSSLVKFTTLDVSPVDVAVTPAATTADLTWNGSSCSYDVRVGTINPDAPVVETELKYDDGTAVSSLGTNGGNFYWASVFNGVASLSKVSIFDYMAMTGTVTIYNGGSSAPDGDPVAEMEIELTGSNAFVDVTPKEAIELDPTKPTWIVVYNASGATFPAAYSAASDANGRWVSIDGSDWMDAATAVSDVGSWLIRATAEASDPNDIIWITEASTDKTSYTFEGLDPETSYIAEVRTNCEEDDEISDWVRTSFTTLDAEAPVSDLVAENITKTSADIDWKVNGAEEEWNLRYRPASSYEFDESNFSQAGSDKTATGTIQEYTFDLSEFSGVGQVAIRHYNITDMFRLNIDDIVIKDARGEVILSEDFEKGEIPANWFNIDADGDGYTWNLWNITQTDSQGNPVGNGNYCATSASYSGDALTPDNWLIIPNVDLGGSITFIARGQDPSWAAEVFGVYVALGEIEESEWTVVEGITEHPYTIEDLEEETEYEAQVQSVYGDTTSEWSESVLFTTPLELVVLDNDYDQPEGETNVEILDAAVGKTVDFTISGRTLYKDGSWNTIALPFILTEEQIEESPLAGATIKTVDPESSIVEGTHVTLNMIDYKDWCEYYEFSSNLLYPSYPYFVKWDEGDDIVDPTFRGVKIYTSDMGYWALNEEESIMGVGLFSSIMLQPASELADDESPIYYMGADNKLKFTGKQRLLNAFRAGFMFETPDAEGALNFTINWGDDTTTGIVEIEGADSRATSAPTGIYNLQGVKLNQLPKQKGVYINNGKKVIIK